MKNDSYYLKKYKDRMTEIMVKTNPKWKKKDIEKIIEKMIEKKLKNPSVELDNNYTGENHSTTLLSVVDWCMERKPIIAGNATFYKNQYEALNPIAQMLDDMAANRKKYKKEMFQAGEKFGQDSPEYQDFDRSQLNEKINMNSYYGASGAPSSAFYSKWSGPATTLTAQSVISTAETLFESFLADNYIYLNLTELMEWIRTVLKEKHELDYFIKKREVVEVVDRLSSKILNKEDNDEIILHNFLLSLSDEDVTRLYYKNNMIEFIKDHEEIQNIFDDILSSIENLDYVDENDKNIQTKIPSKYRYDYMDKSPKDWNKFVSRQYFMDPNDPPKSILYDLELLTKYMMKYVYVEYLSVDRIYRLKNFKRRVVTVIDTDSNFLSLDTLMNFLLEKVIDPYGYGRSYDNNIFILINTITYIITEVIEDMLLFYGKNSNIPEEFRPKFNMKNEFYNELLVIGKAKKRYISKQRLREGNLLDPPKADIKGFDFKKATTSEYTESVFMRIIKDHILNSDTIELKEMIKELQAFKREIHDSIKRGERTFLPNGNAKELAAYKDPGSEQSVRGVLAWNFLNPDNRIEIPSKVSLVKMNIFKEDDMNDLKDTYPEVYKTIMEKIFHDETGIFVVKSWNCSIDYVNPKKQEWFKDIPKKFRTKYKKLGPYEWNKFVDEVLDYENDPSRKRPKGFKDEDRKGYWEYKKRGLQVLAIPSNGKIPEWALDYVDYTTMVNNIMSPIKPVLEIFHSEFPEVGKNRNSVNRKTNTLTNIVKF